MKLKEVDAKLAQLKRRQAELKTKPLKAADGTWDNAILAAEAAIEKEFERLHGLREQAMIEDVVGEVPPEVPPPIAPVLGRAAEPPLPLDLFSDWFSRDEGDEPADRIIDANEDQLKEFQRHLVNVVATDVATHMQELYKGAPDEAVAKKFFSRSARYTNGIHQGIFLAITKQAIDVHRRFLLGRDMRNDLEKRLLARIEALEAAPKLRYVGVWNADTQNIEGEFATHKGAVWHCRRATRQQPGTGSDWQLAVKAGRDGKDAPR